MLKIKEVKLPGAVGTVFYGWRRNFDKIEDIEHGFQEPGIRRDLGQVNVHTGEQLPIGLDRLRREG